jgi:hypothetical protein
MHIKRRDRLGDWERSGRLAAVCGVDHGGGHVVVPQQVLNGAEVGAALTRVGAGGMTNGMGADVLRQTGAANRRLAGFVNDARVTMMAPSETNRRANGESQGRNQTAYPMPWRHEGISEPAHGAGRPRHAPTPRSEGFNFGFSGDKVVARPHAMETDEPYDPIRIQALGVHGSNGTPRAPGPLA